MAGTTVDYYFSLASPFTYMGHSRFEAMARKHGAAVNYKPADIGKIFTETGGLPVPKRSPQRQAYRLMELRRWRDFLGIPLNVQPKYFPVDSGGAARVVIAAMRAGHHPGELIGAYCRAVWAEERNIAEPAEIQAIAKAAGLESAYRAAAEDQQALQAVIEANTAEGIRRGVFGAPTWIIQDEVFWGQDRLDFVERALERG
jgi:2-hydroxychromene-2-carboxylate isomerase